MTSRIIVETNGNGGVSISRKLIIDSNNVSIINHDDIIISRDEKENEMATKIEDIKKAIENRNQTPEDLGAMIGDYLNGSVLENADNPIGGKVEMEGLLLASVIQMVKDSEYFSEDYKERCIKRFTQDMSALQADLEEIQEKGEEMNKVLEEEEIKETKRNKLIKYAKIGFGIVGTFAAGIAAYKIYRHYNPAVITLDMGAVDVITEM